MMVPVKNETGTKTGKYMYQENIFKLLKRVQPRVNIFFGKAGVEFEKKHYPRELGLVLKIIATLHFLDDILLI